MAAALLIRAGLPAAPEQQARISFSIPAGNGVDTLPVAARQAEVEIVFVEQVGSNLQTQAIDGKYTVREAFRAMVKGTPFKVVPVSGGAAYAIISRAPDRGKNGQAGSTREEQSNDPQTNDPTKPMPKKQNAFQKLRNAAAAALAVVAAQSDAQDEGEDGIYELSPFVVEEGTQGYAATTTLAGSRIRTNVNEVGASLSIVTEEFMKDMGATDSESLLMYTGNTEVSGVLGNFANPTFGGSNPDVTPQRLNPQESQRVRGLGSAALMRDYFRTDIPFDSYNTTRVEINRGPNSILFGLGSPSGVINHSLKRALHNVDSSEVAVRFGSEGSHRETFDFNRSLFEDRFAIRIAGINQKTDHKQDSAFQEDRRIYAAFDFLALKNENVSWLGQTSLRGSYETGSQKRRPPNVLPPTDNFSAWFDGYPDPLSLLRVPGISLDALSSTLLTQQDVRDAVAAGLAEVPAGLTLDQYAAQKGQFIPKTLIDRFTEEGLDHTSNTNVHQISPEYQWDSPQADLGWTTPGLEALYGAPIDGIVSRWRALNPATGSPQTSDRRWSGGGDANLGGFGFRSRTLQDPGVFDYRNQLLTGITDLVDDDFDLSQISLDQQFFEGKAGLEVAYDSQTRKRFSFLPSFSRQLHIDIDEWLPVSDENLDFVADRLPNNNVGRPVFRYHNPDFDRRRDEQESFRVTAFGELDLRERPGGKWLGRHTLTGLYEHIQDDFENRNFALVNDNVIGPDVDLQGILNGNGISARHRIKATVYLGPSAIDATDPSQVRAVNPASADLLGLRGRDVNVIYFDNSPEVDGPAFGQWFIRDFLDNGNLGRDVLNSQAVSLQSRILDEHLTTLVAFRRDAGKTFERIDAIQNLPPDDPMRDSAPELRVPTGEFNEAELMFLKNEPIPSSLFDEETFTGSIVARFPEKYLFDLPWGMDLLAHYYYAESFNPGTGNDFLGTPLAPPGGDTTEYGFTIEFNNRLSLRFSKFETNQLNSRTDVSGAVGRLMSLFEFYLSGAIEAEEAEIAIADTNAAGLLGVNSYDEWYQRIIGILPDYVQDVYDLRVELEPIPADPGAFQKVVRRNDLDGVNATNDFVAKGFEMDLVGQITDNLSISMNVARQETTQSNTAPIFSQVAFDVENSIIDNNASDVLIVPARGGTEFYLNQYRSRVSNPVRTTLAQDGTVSLEQREWRVNSVLSYEFDDGKLDGLTVGGAARWQSKVAVGYPLLLDDTGNQIPDLNNAFFGDEELNGDLFLRYDRPITLFGRELDWSLQFNARNLYRGGDDDIPVVINPNGEVAVVRIPNERQFFLTNRFRF